MDALGEQLMHRHKLPVKCMLWESSPSKMQHVVFSLDGTVCLLGAFLGMGRIYPVGMSAATFESFTRPILLEYLNSTPSFNLLLLFTTRVNARYVLAKLEALDFSEEDVKGSGEVRTSISSP